MKKIIAQIKKMSKEDRAKFLVDAFECDKSEGLELWSAKKGEKAWFAIADGEVAFYYVTNEDRKQHSDMQHKWMAERISENQLKINILAKLAAMFNEPSDWEPKFGIDRHYLFGGYESLRCSIGYNSKILPLPEFQIEAAKKAIEFLNENNIEL